MHGVLRSIRKYDDFLCSMVLLDGQRVPLHGHIEITNHCNLRCKHCYVARDSGRSELTEAECLALLDEMAEAGCLRLLLTGGEPLARKDFLSSYTHAKQRGFLITLFTNGTLLTTELADFLQQYPPLLVEISLYGSNQEVYECMTQTPSSFAACVKAIDLLAEKGIRLVLKTVATKATIKDLPAMRDYAEAIGVPFKYDPFILPRLDGSKEPLDLRVPATTVVSLEMESIRRAPHDELLRNLSRDKSPKPPVVVGGPLYSCHAGVDAFHIDSAGLMSLCVLSRVPSYDLRTMSFAEAWRRLTATRDSLICTKEFKCVGCVLRPECPWCPARAELETGDTQSPIPYMCEIVEERKHALQGLRANLWPRQETTSPDSSL